MSVSCRLSKHAGLRGDGRTYLQAGVEGTLLQLLGAGAEGIHEVPTNGGIALDFTCQDGADVRKHPIEHVGDCRKCTV